MKIETIEIAGFASALTALRLPYGKEVRSGIDHYCRVHLDLVDMGVEHIEDTYAVKLEHMLKFTSHTSIAIDKEDLQLMQILVRRGDEHAKVIRGILAYAEITAPIYWWCEMETYRAGHERLSSESTMHIDCRGLSGEELVKEKAEIPMGKELTKVDFFSYQALRKMVMQRHNHRLPEWHQFIDWVKTLPLADELIFVGLDMED